MLTAPQGLMGADGGRWPPGPEQMFSGASSGSARDQTSWLLFLPEAHFCGHFKCGSPRPLPASIFVPEASQTTNYSLGDVSVPQPQKSAFPR